MANVSAETQIPYMSEKIQALIQAIRATGEGPGKTPPIDARELAGLMGIGLNTLPTFGFGQFTVGAAAGGDEHIVNLSFEPKLVIAYIDNVAKSILLKLRTMDLGTPAEKACLHLEVAVDADITVGDYMTLRDETVPVAPATYDLKAFTIWNAALANDDVVNWIAFG